VTDSFSLTSDDDPYQIRQLPFSELDKIKRELHADLTLYPAGTAAPQRLRAHIAAIDAEHARRAENGNVA
jgi:hypothetical protein